jgi:hypothetical protein
MKRALLALVLLSACGNASCGNSAGPSSAHKAKIAGALAYYPFAAGMQWSYMVYGPPGAPGLLKVDKVVAFDGKTAIVQSGDASLTYTVANEAIYREPAHVPLLKWPVTLGDKWPGAKGSKVEVTKVDAQAVTPAGTFEGCVETTESVGGDAAGLLRTTFCPDVGPVIVEIHELNAPPGEMAAHLVGKLRAFGMPVTIPPKGE